MLEQLIQKSPRIANPRINQIRRTVMTLALPVTIHQYVFIDAIMT